MSAGAAVLVDTGPLVALFDPSDRAHEGCRDELARFEGRRLVTSLAVVTEASYLLGFSDRAQQAFLAFVAAGAVELAELDAADVGRSASLMARYSSLPMDLADATLVTLAARLGTVEVFTLDRRDFSVYRLARKRFRLHPSS